MERGHRRGDQRKSGFTNDKEWTGRPVRELFSVSPDRRERQTSTDAAFGHLLPPTLVPVSEKQDGELNYNAKDCLDGGC